MLTLKKVGKGHVKMTKIYLYAHTLTRKLYQIFVFLSFRFYILTGKCGFKIIYSHLSPFRAPRMKLSPFQEKHNCGNSAATEKFLKESRLANSLSSSPNHLYIVIFIVTIFIMDVSIGIPAIRSRCETAVTYCLAL